MDKATNIEIASDYVLPREFNCIVWLYSKK